MSSKKAQTTNIHIRRIFFRLLALLKEVGIRSEELNLLADH